MTTAGASSQAVGGASLAYRPDIDGLRAVAVLSVVGFHAFPSYFPGGFLGVDIFFVISGYLITGLLLRERAATGRISISQFYLRRVRRLFPALLLVVAVTAFAGYFLLFAHEFARLAHHVWASLFFVENILLARESGYFDVDSYAKPLLHFWSLAVEEQFYFIWPLVLLVFARSRTAVGIAIAAISSLSLAITFFGGLSEPWHFYSPLTRAWELGAGAGLAWFHARRDPVGPGRVKLLAHALSLLAIAAIAAIVLLAGNAFRHPGFLTMVPVIATVVLIATGPRGFANRRLLDLRPAVWIGLLSYPLYLWHWPLLSYLAIVSETERGSEVWRAGMVVLAIILAAATYRFVERPVRLNWTEQRAFVLLLSGTALLAIAVAIMIQLRPAADQTLAAAQEAQIEGAFWRYTANEICERNYGEEYRTFCIVNRDATPTVLLFGDSYANHFYAGMVSDPRLKDETILSYGSCEPSAIMPARKDDCSQQMALVENTSSLRLVIVGAAWPLFDDSLVMTNSAASDLIDYPEYDEYRVALLEQMERLARRDIEIILVGPKPEVGYDISDCFGRPFRSATQSCQIMRNIFESKSALTISLLNEIADRYENITYYDPSPLFCIDDICRMITPEEYPLLRDNVHYSVFGSRHAVREMLDWAESEGLELP